MIRLNRVQQKIVQQKGSKAIPFVNGRYASDYKPTGIMVVDMVGACVTHYKGLGVRIKEIKLQPKYYMQFIEAVKRYDPACITAEGVPFDNKCMIVMGSRKQKEPLEPVLIQPKTATT